MSTDPESPGLTPAENSPEDSTAEDDAAVAAARRDKIVEHLFRTWGAVPPPCPYCRVTAWEVDARPILLQRFTELPGFGVPVFLVWCSNCGHEVFLSVAATGLWEEVTGVPLENPEFYRSPSVDKPEAEPDGVA